MDLQEKIRRKLSVDKYFDTRKFKRKVEEVEQFKHRKLIICKDIYSLAFASLINPES